MTQVPLPSVTDFWTLLHQSPSRLHVEAATIMSDAQMKALLTKWLDEEHGVLQEIKRHQIFSVMKQDAQRLFGETMMSRLYQIEHTWKQISILLPESEGCLIPHREPKDRT